MSAPAQEATKFGAAPDVTFLVAAYNVAPYIEAAIESALGQRNADIEVIVVNDGSTDGTEEIVRAVSANTNRVKLISNAASGGPAAARNQAIAAARGEWLAVFDGDDLMAPERTERLLALGTATGADIVADNFERIADSGEPLRRYLFPLAQYPFSFQVDVADFLLGNLAMETPVVALGAIKPLIRRNFIEDNDLTFPEDLAIGEDYHFIMDALLAGGTFIVTSEPHYKYRMRPGSQSWRLKPGHTDALIAAHERSGIAALAANEPRIATAAEKYVTSLKRAGRFVNLVETVKTNGVGPGLAASARDPGIWPLLLKHGSAAAGKRVGRVFKGAA